MTSHQDVEDMAAALFAAVERLRALGVEKQIQLPQIVVFGDQSSGKSALLRGVYGIPFPTDAGLCTRYPTRLTMKRTTGGGSEEPTITASIEAHGGDEATTYPGFPQTTGYPGDVPRIMREAADAMGLEKPSHDGTLNPEGKRFSRDVLRLEMVSSRFKYDLTVVDLPGLFLFGDNKKQTNADVVYVEKMIIDYITRSHTVVLAIMPATQEFVNQAALRFLDQHARKDVKVLAILTKPDKIEHDEEARNDRIRDVITNAKSLPLGWHMVRNFPPEKNEADLNMSEERKNRLQREKAFFAQPGWQGLHHDKKGLASLERRILSIQTKLHNDSFTDVVKAAESVIGDLDTGMSELSRNLSADGIDLALLFELSSHLKAGMRRPPLQTDGPLALNSNMTDAIAQFTTQMKSARRKTFSCGMEVRDLEREMGKDVRSSLSQQIQKYTMEKNDPPGRVSPEVVLKMFESCSQEWTSAVDTTIDSLAHMVGLFVEAFFKQDQRYSRILSGFKQTILMPSLRQLKGMLRPSKPLGQDLNDIDDGLSHELLRGLPDGRARYVGQLLQNQMDRQQSNHATTATDQQVYDFSTLRKAFEQALVDEVEASDSAEALASLCVFYQDRFETLLKDFRKDNVMSHVQQVIMNDMFSIPVVRSLSTEQQRGICVVDGTTQAELQKLQQRKQDLQAALGEFTKLIQQPAKRPRDETSDAGYGPGAKRLRDV